MTAAILQGAPGTTVDTDLWVDLPERAYMRVINLCARQGAEIIRPTVVALQDGTLVNFCYRLDGVGAFASEWKRARRLKLAGQTVRVMPLRSIIRSKAAAGREKDIAQLPILRKTAACGRVLRR